MKREGQQLRLDVRLFLVKADGFCDLQIQAASAPAAKYQAFKMGREAGYFPRFRDFLNWGFTAEELRR